jgi:hypothetical protein
MNIPFLFHFVFLSITRIVKNSFRYRMIYIVSLFHLRFRMFHSRSISVTYIFTPEIQKVHIRSCARAHTHTHKFHARMQRHIFLAVLLLNKFFFAFPKFRIANRHHEESTVEHGRGKVRKKFWPSLLRLRHYRRACIPVVYHLICDI